ncbi:DUF1289 domain-containing protein [Thiohalobacter sp.]|uniref:DUF1289 domain-containing protein n=1 Tax=Thiohalobacter sp. TaxID=2025948 RepID=UPI00261F4E2A|nr:DUF1289 domain-containing protein [Thiohalobacter sp.]
MKTEPAPEPAPRSPCVRNCCLDRNDICLGCGRALEEIIEWGGADDVRRRVILAQAARRLRARERS